VFDSGLGGLTVLGEFRRLRPDVDIVYVADDAAFPTEGSGRRSSSRGSRL
jgi:glutamate racemase